MRLSAILRQQSPLPNLQTTQFVSQDQNLTHNEIVDETYYLSDALTLYNGIPLSQIRPVFQAACRLCYSNPQISQIIAVTQTTLETHVVSAIIKGALRLVFPGEDPVEEAMRKQKQRARAEQALHAEENFVNKVRIFQNQIWTKDSRNRLYGIRQATGRTNSKNDAGYSLPCPNCY